MFGESISWPNKANCAAMITVNLDAEYFWISMFPDSASRPKTLSMGQYGITRGLQRVLDVFDRFGLKATFFVPGRVAELYPAQVREIVNKGHEIGNHGYAHENMAALSIDEQRKAIQKGNDVLEKICQVRPVGFRAPEGEMTRDTMQLLAELGFKYSSSLFNGDYPYHIKQAGQETGLIEIPLHWDLNDFPYFAFNYHPPFPSGQGRPANYTQVLNIWQDEFEAYNHYGLCYVPQFDPQTIGTPGRIALLEDLLKYINTLGSTWFCTGSEMAEFCRSSQIG
jgi:peptidoglycan/xylan/chitin deacetylase (PgdA/CDA1 family)